MEHFTKCKGFSMIEVLVSVIVLAVGLLGLSGLQVLGLKNNQDAYHRTQLTVLAYDIADRMRANVSSVTDYVDYTSSTHGSHTMDSCSGTSGCTGKQIAENDMHEWFDAISLLLPSGAGNVSAVGTLDYRVSLSWDHDKNSGTSDKTFQLSFRL